MQEIHKKRIKLKITLVFTLAIFLVIFNPYDRLSSVRNFLHTIFMPIVQIGYIGGNKVQDMVVTIKSVGSIKQDNQNLYKENLELKSKITELKDIKNENDDLKKELNLLPKEDLNLIGADVINRDISGKIDWIEINRGSQDGLVKGLPVIVAGKNLIGFVDEVFINHAKIKLINHPDSSINIVTVESGVEAIAKGEHGISIKAESIHQDAEIEAGMTFITSKISSKCPKGFSVGVIQSVSATQDGLFKEARITPLVNFDKIRFVFVVIQ